MYKLRIFFVLLVAIFGICYDLSANQDMQIEDELYVFPLDGKVRFLKVINEHNLNIIVLSDNSQWSIYNDQDYENVYNTWSANDNIVISRDSKSRTGDFVLKNKTTDDMVFVELNNLNRKNVLAYTICKIDENGYFITTDNEIDWTISWYDSWTTMQWKNGDKIIINDSDDVNLLINLNTRESVYARKTKWK